MIHVGSQVLPCCSGPLASMFLSVLFVGGGVGDGWLSETTGRIENLKFALFMVDVLDL